MRDAIRWLFGVGCAGLVLTAVGCGGSRLTVPSTWPVDPVVVDGDAAEWDGGLTPVPDIKGSLGVRNDDSTLWVCVITADREIQRRILVDGLTIWINADGSHDKRFGVRYPTGLEEFMPPMTGGERDSVGRARLRHELDAALVEMEIIGPGSLDRMRYGVDEVSGVTARVNQARGLLMLELTVPLGAGRGRFSIPVDAGGVLALGLESARVRQGGGPPGGRPGGGFGGRRGRGGMGMPSGREPAKDIETWVIVPMAGSTRLAGS